MARQLLEQMRVDHCEPRWPFEGDVVADYLDLRVVWESVESDQEWVAAVIQPAERLIRMNIEMVETMPEGFHQSSIAHEIGHWILHIDHEVVQAVEQGSLICRPMVESVAAHYRQREWQAQYFATCLLMPKDVVIQVCRGVDLTDLYQLYGVAEKLGVTVSNLVHRLKDFGWIYRDEDWGPIEWGPRYQEDLLGEF